MGRTINAFDEKPVGQQYSKHPEDEMITLRWILDKHHVDLSSCQWKDLVLKR
jgi:hypothetical protein